MASDCGDSFFLKAFGPLGGNAFAGFRNASGCWRVGPGTVFNVFYESQAEGFTDKDALPTAPVRVYKITAESGSLYGVRIS